MTEQISSNILSKGVKSSKNVSFNDVFDKLLVIFNDTENLTKTAMKDIENVYSRGISKQQEQKLNKVNSIENTLNNEKEIDTKTKQI